MNIYIDNYLSISLSYPSDKKSQRKRRECMLVSRLNQSFNLLTFYFFDISNTRITNDDDRSNHLSSKTTNMISSNNDNNIRIRSIFLRRINGLGSLPQLYLSYGSLLINIACNRLICFAKEELCCLGGPCFFHLTMLELGSYYTLAIEFFNQVLPVSTLGNCLHHLPQSATSVIVFRGSHSGRPTPLLLGEVKL